MKQNVEDGCKLSAAVIIWSIIIGLLIVGGSIYALVALKAQHDIINPQVRQNMVDDPATTIANRKDFHNKLSEIITSDQNVQTNLNALVTCDSTCSNHDTLENELLGVEQIRSTAINAYNAQADNPDVGKDLEKWMPHHIAISSIPANTDTAQTVLQTEINNLQSIYNKGE